MARSRARRTPDRFPAAFLRLPDNGLNVQSPIPFRCVAAFSTTANTSEILLVFSHSFDISVNVFALDWGLVIVAGGPLFDTVDTPVGSTFLVISMESNVSAGNSLTVPNIPGLIDELGRPNETSNLVLVDFPG